MISAEGRKQQISWKKKAFSPVDNSALIAFRIIFGFLMLVLCTQLFLSGELEETYIKPSFTFSFIGLEFIKPFPGVCMYFFVGIMAVFALMIMFAERYRIGATGFAIMWTLLYLMQKVNANNFYYLVLLFSWILVFMPANRYFSFDTKRRRVHQSLSCSRWIPTLFIFQMSVMYLYTAFFWLNSDWLSGELLNIKFSKLVTHSILSGFYGNPAFPKIISWGGLISNLLIVPLLLWRRTALIAFLFSLFILLFSFISLSPGIFPFLCIAGNLFFLDPQKVRSVFFPNKPPLYTIQHIQTHKVNNNLLVILGIYMVIQIILPLRSLFYPYNVLWSNEGYRMSWRFMLRAKDGHIAFKVVDNKSGNTWRILTTERFSLSHAQWIATSPDLTWQYAQELKSEFKKRGINNVAVYAIGEVSLNGKTFLPLIDSTVNLAEVSWSYLSHSNWILPFKSSSEDKH